MHALNKRFPLGRPSCPSLPHFRQVSSLDVVSEVRSADGTLLATRSRKEPVYKDVDPASEVIPPDVTAEMYEVEYLEAHGVTQQPITQPYFTANIDSIASAAEYNMYGIDFDLRSSQSTPTAAPSSPTVEPSKSE